MTHGYEYFIEFDFIDLDDYDIYDELDYDFPDIDEYEVQDIYDDYL